MKRMKRLLKTVDDNKSSKRKQSRSPRKDRKSLYKDFSGFGSRCRVPVNNTLCKFERGTVTVYMVLKLHYGTYHSIGSLKRQHEIIHICHSTCLVKLAHFMSEDILYCFQALNVKFSALPGDQASCTMR